MSTEGPRDTKPQQEEETVSQKIGRIDAQISLINVFIVQLGASGEKGYSQERLNELTKRKDELIIERTILTGDIFTRNPSYRNRE